MIKCNYKKYLNSFHDGRYRDNEEFKLQELADYLSISRQHLFYIINNQRKPSLEVAIKMYEFINRYYSYITFDMLFEVV